MEERIKTSWEQFKQTGAIEAYLMYKKELDFGLKEDKEDTWQKSKREVLS